MDSFWSGLLVPGVPFLDKAFRTLAVYTFLAIGLRLAGKRELGQLNQFDLIVLLMLSNTVQNAIIGDDSSLAGGLFGAAVLLAANFLVVRFLYGHPWLDHLVEGEPEELVRAGRLLRHNLRRNMITRLQLEAAARRQGIGTLADVDSCRLEVGGVLTFVQKQPTLADRRYREVLDRLDRIERLLGRSDRAVGAGPAG